MTPRAWGPRCPAGGARESEALLRHVSHAPSAGSGAASTAGCRWTLYMLSDPKAGLAPLHPSEVWEDLRTAIPRSSAATQEWESPIARPRRIFHVHCGGLESSLFPGSPSLAPFARTAFRTHKPVWVPLLSPNYSQEGLSSSHLDLACVHLATSYTHIPTCPPPQQPWQWLVVFTSGFLLNP